MIAPEPQVTVDLWSARIPMLGRFAEHHWLVVCRPGVSDRWEVWQTPNSCSDSWGHLHRNLMHPTSGVGNGRGRMLTRWIGRDAANLADRIEMAPETYPWRDVYFVFPGPNSNTFVQWALGSLHTIGWRGVGRWFAKREPQSDARDKV